MKTIYSTTAMGNRIEQNSNLKKIVSPLLSFILNDPKYKPPKVVHHIVLTIILTTALLLCSIFTFANNYFAVANGNWNNAAIWSFTNGGTGGAGIPTASDNVTVCFGKTVIMNLHIGNCKNLTITGTLSFSNTNSLNVNGNLTMNNGGVITGTSTGIVIISGNLSVSSAGTSAFGRVSLTVSGTTTIAGAVNFSNSLGIKTFKGGLKINSGGSWTSTAIITPSNLIFQNGITHNGSTFKAGACTFNTNNQTLTGNALISFSNAIVVTGINLTNSTSVTMANTTAGSLSGHGKWIQGANSTFNYSGQTITISQLDASAPGNIINYNGINSQNIFIPPNNKYYNLTLSNTNTKTPTANVVISGNLSIQGTAIFSVKTYDISIAGNWINSSTASDPFTEGTRTVTFNGTSAQHIFNTGNTNGTVFNNITINNSFPSIALTLNTPITVNGILSLQKGHIVTTAANILVMGTSASVSLGSTPNKSFVEGPMIQNYNSMSSVTKMLPVGKGNIIHPVNLTIQQTNTKTTQYKAEYFKSSATALGFILASSLSKVSDVDYWDISNNGAPNIKTASIQLYYSAIDYVNDAPNLRIAKSNGAGSWLDIGGTGTAAPTGTIISSVNFTTAFSKFSLANKKSGSNPLPIELLSFNATSNNDFVNLTWSTASETNNDYFTIEKSKDAINFEPLVNVDGAGNSNTLLNYTAKDNEPFSGVSYYRLKQTDFNGKFTYSNLATVDFEKSFDFKIYPNPFSTQIIININNVSLTNEIELRIYNVNGVEVVNTIVTNELTTIDTSNLPSGIYFYKIIDNDKDIQTGKLLSQN
jgi:hypothetical protein